MYIIVVGLGGIGKNLVSLATRDKNDVVVIDKDAERCKQIAQKYDVISIVGDSTSKSVLEEAGGSRADALIVTTSDDAVNLMTVLVARDLGIKSVVSVVNKEEHINMFVNAGVSIQENPDLLVAEHLYKSIQKPSIKDFMEVMSGKAEILSIIVGENSEIAGKNIADIPFGEDVLVIAIERNNELIIPKGNTKIMAGDIAYIFVPENQVERVTALF
ncbi:MAG: potassium channel family protein [Candidatus Hydrothermarchaeota archaeon]